MSGYRQYLSTTKGPFEAPLSLWINPIQHTVVCVSTVAAEVSVLAHQSIHYADAMEGNHADDTGEDDVVERR